jgi:AraC family transcriptional regulator
MTALGQDAAAPSRADQAVQAARAWIDAHVGEPFTLADLAAQVGLDANYLAARVRERVGRPVMDYRLEKRLQQARHLLTCTNYPQKTIARELGFTDSPHLSHAFRKRFGLSPGRLRATARG